MINNGQSVEDFQKPNNSCSGYDSEVASIMSSKTPIYENLVPSSKNRMHNSIPLQHPISSLQHPISSMQHPLVHHPISSVQHPITTIPHHLSGVQHPISNIQHPISSLHQHSILHHNNPILTNPMVWQPQQLNPPSGAFPFVYYLESNFCYLVDSIKICSVIILYQIYRSNTMVVNLVRQLNLNECYINFEFSNNLYQMKVFSGRNSADRQYNNNDSLSSSGVYSEEERKLNLKAR